MITMVTSGNGGAGWVVKSRDAGVQLEKALRPMSRTEPSLLTFLASHEAVGLIGQVVAASDGNNMTVLHATKHGKFPEGCSVPPELVGMDDLRHVVLLQQSLEERSGGSGVEVFLKENIQHGSAFVHGPP